MNYHALAVDVGNLEIGQFGAPHADGIQGDQDGAVDGSESGFDKPGNFIGAQDDGEVQSLLRVRGLLHVPGLFERLDEEKPQGSHTLVDGVVGQLPNAEEIRHVLADVFGAELIRRRFEIARKVLDGAEVGARGTLRVITTLEFLEHHFS